MKTLNNNSAGKCWDWLISTERFILRKYKQQHFSENTKYSRTILLHICLVVCLYIPTTNMDLSEVFEMSRTVPVWHPMPRFGFFQRLRLRLMALLLLYLKGATADVWLLTPQPGTNSGDIADKLNECRTLAPNNTTNLFTRVKPRRSIVYCILALARQQTYSIISCNAFI